MKINKKTYPALLALFALGTFGATKTNHAHAAQVNQNNDQQVQKTQQVAPLNKVVKNPNTNKVNNTRTAQTNILAQREQAKQSKQNMDNILQKRITQKVAQRPAQKNTNPTTKVAFGHENNNQNNYPRVHFVQHSHKQNVINHYVHHQYKLTRKVSRKPIVANAPKSAKHIPTAHKIDQIATPKVHVHKVHRIHKIHKAHKIHNHKSIRKHTVQPKIVKATRKFRARKPKASNSSSSNDWFRDGLSHSNMKAREWVSWHESRDEWNVLSYGHRCIGRYQLDPAYLGRKNGHVNLDHKHQVKVADRYVAQRYGSWLHAKAFWESHHWY